MDSGFLPLSVELGFQIPIVANYVLPFPPQGRLWLPFTGVNYDVLSFIHRDRYIKKLAFLSPGIGTFAFDTRLGLYQDPPIKKVFISLTQFVSALSSLSS